VVGEDDVERSALEWEAFGVTLHKRDAGTLRPGEGARVTKLLTGQIDADRAGALLE
jgi:hypothetical protein